MAGHATSLWTAVTNETACGTQGGQVPEEQKNKPEGGDIPGNVWGMFGSGTTWLP